VTHPLTRDQLVVVAQLLDELGGEIDDLGAVLCGDPEFVARHGRELQAIDLISQMQRALSGVLQAECVACAVQDVRVEQLRERLATLLPHDSCRHAA